MNPKLDPLVQEYCKNKSEDLKPQIIENYLPLIEYIARKLAFNKDDVEDLVQVGSIALLKALDRFEMDKNTEFSTFATPNIIGEIKHYFRDKSRLVKVPRKLQELNSKIKTAINESQQKNETLTISMLATKFETTEEKVIEAMEAGQSSRIISLDSPSFKSNGMQSGSSDSTLIDQIPTADNQDALLNKETLKQAILKLESRERRIIYLRFYGGLSQAEIAERLKLSQMHISRLISRSIRNLKKELNRH